MSAKTKPLADLPVNLTETQEDAFWQTHDSTDFIDWTKAQPVILPRLKPSLRTISLRLPEHLLAELKLLANRRDVPYQSLIKVFLAERVRQELERGGPAKP